MKFKMQQVYSFDKEIYIDGPDEMVIKIDFDDVDKFDILKNSEKIIEILNINW